MGRLEIQSLHASDIPDAVRLWRAQYAEAEACVPALPQHWQSGGQIADYLREHAGERGIAAKSGGGLAGYMVFDSFMFHGERACFCPIVGHAAHSSLRPAAYGAMYRRLSEEWVRAGCLTHLASFFAHDDLLCDLYFRLGFGLVNVDAFRSTEPLGTGGPGVDVVQGAPEHSHDLYRLEQEARAFYAEAPIFLHKPVQGPEASHQRLADPSQAVFMAYDRGKAVGFMAATRQEAADVYTLADSSLDAYIRPGHRGRRLGARLLEECLSWCRDRELAQVHVDFESANPYGSRFWLKHFTPAVYSVKRRVDMDILSTDGAV